MSALPHVAGHSYFVSENAPSAIVRCAAYAELLRLVLERSQSVLQTGRCVLNEKNGCLRYARAPRDVVRCSDCSRKYLQQIRTIKSTRGRRALGKTLAAEVSVMVAKGMWATNLASLGSALYRLAFRFHSKRSQGSRSLSRGPATAAT